MNEKLKDFQKKFHSADWWYQDAFDEKNSGEIIEIPEWLQKRVEEAEKMAKYE